MTHLRSTLLATTVATLCAAAISGCGGSDSNDGTTTGTGGSSSAGKGGSAAAGKAGAAGSTGGAAGKAGAAGSTGGTGTAGKAGSAGTGGSTGGAAGKAGSGGSTGGAAGKAGSSGTGGSTGGAAGKAGSGGSTGGAAGKAGSGGSTGGAAGKAGAAGSAGSTGGAAGKAGAGGSTGGAAGKAGSGGSTGGAAGVAGSAGAGGSVDQCADGQQDGSETGVDCGGGTCGTCDLGGGCTVATDCTSTFCDGAVCVDSQCKDKAQDGAETGIDCGGGTCDTCGLGLGCAVDGDCASGICVEGTCDAARPTSCLDLITNHPNAATGVKTIDPDGAGAIAPFAAYCDMTAGDAGWTLVMKAIGTNFGYDDALWADNTVPGDGNFDFTTVGLSKYSAYLSVPFTTLRSSFADDFTKHYDYSPAAGFASAQALFGPNVGIQISASIPAPLDAYWQSLVNVQNQQLPVANGGCLNYTVVGINMKAFLGVGFLPGGGLCDWNGGARFGQRVDANHMGTGNHTGQGWGSYTTLNSTNEGESQVITQLMWVR